MRIHRERFIHCLFHVSELTRIGSDVKIWRHTSTENTIQQKESLVSDSKARISTVYAILVIDLNVVSVNFKNVRHGHKKGIL